MRRISFLLTLVLSLIISPAGPVQQAGGTAAVLDLKHHPLSSFTDGDSVLLQLALGPAAGTDTLVSFKLDGSDVELGSCTIPAGKARCETGPLDALGWRWQAGKPSPNRKLFAQTSGAQVVESALFEVKPRPVVMVHGFASSAAAWINYLGPQGYLASLGIPGYAVGDGQVEGAMNTGNLAAPLGRTHTIAENAAILGQYIEQVKKATGAQKVDLLAHSMGGLISRYYIDRLMDGREVGQLIMLGSPQAGTDCAELPSSLGYYLPAALEIRPSYVEGIFNQEITHRHGVPFNEVAGIPIVEAFKSPCTGVPTDVAVSLDSANYIPVNLQKVQVLHTDLNSSRQVFQQAVAPMLEKGPGEFPNDPDPLLGPINGSQMQFSRVFTGHLAYGQNQELTIQIDPGITLAGFALYDSSRSLAVEVRGASGNVIPLDPTKNGLLTVNDPSSLVYLGYGFENPKPGAWKVTLQTTTQTSSSGADYAITAHYAGGAALEASAAPLLPEVNQSVGLTAKLSQDGKPLAIQSAQAVVRFPDLHVETVTLASTGGPFQSSWTPSKSGVYAVQVTVIGQGADGAVVERTAFLTVEAQPKPDTNKAQASLWLILGGIGLAALLIAAAVIVIFLRLLRGRKMAA